MVKDHKKYKELVVLLYRKSFRIPSKQCQKLTVHIKSFKKIGGTKMKKFSFPTVVMFGEAIDLIQGCDGWGVEGLSLDDSDRQLRWLYTDKWHCICTTLRGNRCD